MTRCTAGGRMICFMAVRAMILSLAGVTMTVFMVVKAMTPSRLGMVLTMFMAVLGMTRSMELLMIWFMAALATTHLKA